MKKETKISAFIGLIMGIVSMFLTNLIGKFMGVVAFSSTWWLILGLIAVLMGSIYHFLLKRSLS